MGEVASRAIRSTKPGAKNTQQVATGVRESMSKEYRSPSAMMRKLRRIDHQFSPVDNPGHLSGEDRLDGQRPSVVFHLMAPSACLQHHIVRAQASARGEEIRLLSRLSHEISITSESDVVVHRELPGMWPQSNLVSLHFSVCR